MHFNRSFKKFNIKITINFKQMQLISKIDIRILKLQISTKLKLKSHVKKLQNKIINQTLTLIKFIAFTYKVIFNKVKNFFKAIIKSSILYKLII